MAADSGNWQTATRVYGRGARVKWRGWLRGGADRRRELLTGGQQVWVAGEDEASQKQLPRQSKRFQLLARRDPASAPQPGLSLPSHTLGERECVQNTAFVRHILKNWGENFSVRRAEAIVHVFRRLDQYIWFKVKSCSTLRPLRSSCPQRLGFLMLNMKCGSMFNAGFFSCFTTRVIKTKKKRNRGHLSEVWLFTVNSSAAD